MSGRTLPLLHESRELLVVAKPPGLLTIPGRESEHGPSLHELLQAERKERLWVVHRLDRGTSGCIAFARSAAMHRTLSMAFEAEQVRKRYLALVAPPPPTDALTVALPLVAARRGRMKPAREGEQGKPSVTHFKVVERFARFAWLEARPETGRLHQIRVHAAFSGFPLAVDPAYRGAERLTARDLGGADDTVLLDRTPLHCVSMVLPLPEGPLQLEAPLPEDLERVLAQLRRASPA